MELDPSGRVTVSTDLRVVMAVPPPFSLIPKGKIESALVDAFKGPTAEAMAKVCAKVSEVYAAWVRTPLYIVANT